MTGHFPAEDSLGVVPWGKGHFPAVSWLFESVIVRRVGVESFSGCPACQGISEDFECLKARSIAGLRAKLLKSFTNGRPQNKEAKYQGKGARLRNGFYCNGSWKVV